MYKLTQDEKIVDRNQRNQTIFYVMQFMIDLDNYEDTKAQVKKIRNCTLQRFCLNSRHITRNILIMIMQFLNFTNKFILQKNKTQKSTRTHH